ncbi:Hypothetical protein POVN_LOCUS652 [uncultured virus]|nr:Hypothetical protein POVN_LOCUS652 [uncultured virus]
MGHINKDLRKLELTAEQRNEMRTAHNELASDLDYAKTMYKELRVEEVPSAPEAPLEFAPSEEYKDEEPTPNKRWRTWGVTKQEEYRLEQLQRRNWRKRFPPRPPLVNLV